MEKTLEQFIVDNFEALDGTTDNIQEKEFEEIEAWDYYGDKLIFSIESNLEGIYFVRLWHENNRDLKSETIYHEPTEEELVKVVQDILDDFDESYLKEEK